MKRIFVALLGVSLIVVPRASMALSDKIYKELSTFSKVLDIVDKVYVDEADEKKLIRGAIQGMLQSLDPHTVYLPAEIYKNFNSDTKGRFGGVGIEVTVKDGVLTVISPLKDTPAWNAGIKSGDKIVRINEKSTKNMGLGEAVIEMRGPVGKKINLTIWRNGKTNQVSLVRELIRIEGVKVQELEPGYSLFHVTSFQEGVGKALRKAIQKEMKKPEGLKGMVLDLRDDPGGLLDEAVKVSDLFIAKGVIVSTKGRNQAPDVKRAHESGTFTDLPLVVLINGGSASASEIVAGALKDHKRGKLLGTRSFGKGSVQTVINLDNGDAVKITIAHYMTPKDKMIDGKGIDPDVLIDNKAFQKSKNLTKDQMSKVTRDEFLEFQNKEALSHLKKVVR